MGREGRRCANLDNPGEKRLQPSLVALGVAVEEREHITSCHVGTAHPGADETWGGSEGGGSEGGRSTRGGSEGVCEEEGVRVCVRGRE